MKRLLPVVTLLLIFQHNYLYPRGLEEIRRSGKIFIGLTDDDFRNINHPLAVEFARYLNVELIPVKIEWEDAFRRNGTVPEHLADDPGISYTPDIFQKVDIIFSTFTVLEWRKKLFDFAETLLSAELILIGKDVESPKNAGELRGMRIAFQQGTSFEGHMRKINTGIGGGIDLVITGTGEEAKTLLLEGKISGIILDADEALQFSASNPNRFKIALPISPVSKTAYAVEKGNPLKGEVENFFQTIAINGVLDDIFFRQFGLSYSRFVDQISRSTVLQVCHRDLNEIIRSKKLVVALRERNFIYKEGEQKQFMHALAEEFADHLGVQLEFLITPYFAKYWETESGNLVKDSVYTPDWFNYFDLACEVIAPLDWRKQKADLTGIYPTEYAVIARKNTVINRLEDLRKLKGITARGTVYEEKLLENNITNFYFAPVDDFIREVDEGKADYTIIYNAFLELSNYPELESKLSLGEFEVCWAMRKDQPALKAELESFIRSSRKKGLINILMKAIRGTTLQASDDFINSYYRSFQSGQLPSVLYGAEDGLPQEDVFSIFQDNKGYMWFGTSSGVVRYNGREMDLFDKSRGLEDNTILDIRQDSTGILYFATARGIAVFHNDTILRNIFPNTSFRSVYVDRKNNKWFIGEDGLYQLREDGEQVFLNRHFTGLPDNIYAIDQDRNSDDVYIASAEGIYCLSLEENTLLRISEQDCYSLYIDFNDSIWLGTGNGLLISSLHDLKNGVIRERSRRLNRILDAPSSIIKNISQNRFGSVWLTTDSEILQVLSTDQRAFRYEKEIGLKNNKILSFWIDKEENMWIGFSGGLQRLSNKKGLRNFYPNTINSFIYSICEDRNERLWIASANGMYYFSDELHSYLPESGINGERFVVALMPDENLLMVNTSSMYLIDVNTLRVLKKRQFPQALPSLENVFVSSFSEIFLLTGINGSIHYFRNFSAAPVIHKNRNTSGVFQLVEYEGQIVGGNKIGLTRFRKGEFEQMADMNCNVWSLCYNDEKLWVGSECGLGIYNQGTYTVLNPGSPDTRIVIKCIYPAKNKNYLWLGTNNGFSYFNKTTLTEEFTINSKDGLSGDEITVNGLYRDSNDLLWIGTYHGISNFNIRAKSQKTYAPLCYIEKVLLNGSRLNYLERNIFKHFENNLVFEIAGLSYSDERSIEYEFYLRGVENDYSSYNKGNEYKAYYSNLPPGRYEFIYKARGKNNVWSYAQKYEFTVKKAWYDTLAFRLGVILLLAFAAWSFYKIRVRAIEQEKKKLDQLVKERTRELEAANVEIEAQRDLAEQQRDQISQQKKEITDSIYYAQRIQKSLLPSQSVLKEMLPEHFVLFKPRDIVSGDFYWATRKNNKLLIAAVDCTGHGVPGAFMSMLGTAFLNEIMNKYDNLRANEILNYLRREIIKALQQKKEGESKDGMDMALCIIDRESMIIEFAGANNPLYLVHNSEIREIKGDKMPVAIHESMDPFTRHEIPFTKEDVIYLFSDGYADQFGGPEGKKFMYRAFRELLLQVHHKPAREQARILDQTIEKWKDHYDQVDDILVMGLKL